MFPACFLPYRIPIQVFDAHAKLCGNEAKDVLGNHLHRRQNAPRISEGAELEREAQPVVCAAPQPDLLDVVVGQRVMAQQRGFVRGKVEQRRALAHAPDVSSWHVPSLRGPVVSAGAALSVRGTSSGRHTRPLQPRPNPLQQCLISMVRKLLQKRNPIRTLSFMIATLIGYARCSTDRQDLAAQRQALLDLGVAEDRIYTDHGLTGTSRARPGLDQALAAVREDDTLVVPKLDRLARSVPDARAIADRL